MNTLGEIQQFCDKHEACREGKQWALEHCHDMAEVWDTIRPDWLIWVATRPGVLDDRTLRLFACWCARNTPIGHGRTTWDLLTDPHSRHAVEVAERFARGEASVDDLAEAWSAAWSAAWAAASAAADAVWAAARAAARDAQAANLRSMVPNPFRDPFCGEVLDERDYEDEDDE